MPKKRPPAATGDPKIERVALSKLAKWEKNPKNHDMDFLGDAFRVNGFAEFPTVDEGTGKLVAGNGRVEKLELMKAAGEEPPARVEVRGSEWFVPVIRGMTFPRPDKHVLASNRGVELGGWDNAAFAAMLSAIGKDDLIGTGVDGDEFVSFMAKSAAPDAFPSVGEDLPTSFCCPKCRHRWSGDPQAGAEKEDKRGADKKKVKRD